MKHTTLLLLILIGLVTVAAVSPGVLLRTQELLADIGIGLTVSATPVNTRMQELDELARELDVRERAIELDEQRTALWAALAILAGLVAVNYFLDWRRNRT